jgi:DNA-binding MarR family transcriptional regulator
MSNMILGLGAKGPPQQGDGVTLSPRDVADALRLLNLLLKGHPDDFGLAPAGLAAERAPVASDGKAVAPSPATLKVKARAITSLRQARARQFGRAMFSEPAWDILLALYGAEDSERRMTVTGLAEMSGAPMTTALRWLDYLEQCRLIVRVASPTDRRVMFVQLAPLGVEKMSAYLTSVEPLRL